MSNYAHIPLDVYNNDLADAQNQIDLFIEEAEVAAHNTVADKKDIIEAVIICYSIQRDLLNLPFNDRDKFYRKYEDLKEQVEKLLDV